jgi:hypothetical protein
MASGIHDEARRLRVAAALLATAERSAAGRPADASPMSSNIRRTIRMVGSISWPPSLFPSLFPTLQSQTETKVPCPRTGHQSTQSWGLVFTAKHGACASPRLFWPQLNAPPLAVWPMLGRQAGHLFAMRRGIPGDRGRNRFSFHRRFPCSLLPRLCARLLSRARHVIHRLSAM